MAGGAGSTTPTHRTSASAAIRDKDRAGALQSHRPPATRKMTQPIPPPAPLTNLRLSVLSIGGRKDSATAATGTKGSGDGKGGERNANEQARMAAVTGKTHEKKRLLLPVGFGFWEEKRRGRAFGVLNAANTHTQRRKGGKRVGGVVIFGFWSFGSGLFEKRRAKKTFFYFFFLGEGMSVGEVEV